MPSRFPPPVLLVGILALAATLRLGGAALWPGIFRPDEVFQNLEPAYGLVAGQWIVSWEWREGVRGWLLPDMLAAIMAVGRWLGLDAPGIMGLIAAVLSAVSLSVVWLATTLGWRRAGMTGALACGTLTATWPDLVYFSPRPLAEVQAGTVLAASTLLTALVKPPVRRRISALIGGLLGLVVALRFHLGPAALLIAAIHAWPDLRRRAGPMVLAASLPLGLLALSDTLAWGSPFQSIWKNVTVNIIEGRADSYGIQPFAWYGFALLELWGPALPVVTVLAAIGARAAPALAAAAAVVILSHALVAHKELSFIYAALPMILVLAGLGTAIGLAALGRLRPAMGHRAAPWAATALGLALALFVARDGTRFYWTLGAEPLDHWRTLRNRADLCGLGLAGQDFRWWQTGGHAWLNRPVPILLLETPEALAAGAGAVNYLVTRRASLPDAIPGFETLRCGERLCLMHRDAPCAASTGEWEINAVLGRQPR